MGKRFIGLLRDNRQVEYDARFVLGDLTNFPLLDAKEKEFLTKFVEGNFSIIRKSLKEAEQTNNRNLV